MSSTDEESKEGDEDAATTSEEQSPLPSPVEPSLPESPKSSLSPTLTNNNTTTTTDASHKHRRRLTTCLASTIFSRLTSPEIAIPRSRIPTPRRLNHTASYLDRFNTSNGSSNGSARVPLPQPRIVESRRPRNISERLGNTDFLRYQPDRSMTNPVTVDPITLKVRPIRQSSVQIEQHSLMAPIHPGLPSSQTTGNLNLGQSQQMQSSPLTPHFMRPTSSSNARRGNLNTTASPPSQRKTPNLPTRFGKTPTSEHRSTSFSRKASDKTPTGPRRSTPFQPKSSDTAPKTPDEKVQKPGYLPLPPGEPIPSHPRQIPNTSEKSLPAVPEAGSQDKKPETEGFGEIPIVNLTGPLPAGTISPTPSPESDDLLTASPDKYNPRLIHAAMPLMQWAGRFTALSDRFLTGALPSPNTAPTSSHDLADFLPYSSKEPMHDDEKRKHRIYTHLHSLCTTDEARISLKEFINCRTILEKSGPGPSSSKAGKEKHKLFHAFMSGGWKKG